MRACAGVHVQPAGRLHACAGVHVQPAGALSAYAGALEQPAVCKEAVASSADLPPPNDAGPLFPAAQWSVALKHLSKSLRPKANPAAVPPCVQTPHRKPPAPSTLKGELGQTLSMVCKAWSASSNPWRTRNASAAPAQVRVCVCARVREHVRKCLLLDQNIALTKP
eukprot:1159264-Pelagomonas_calceolata.AAC.7